MKDTDFVSDRLGRLNWESRGMYYRFEPSLLPFDIELSNELVVASQKAALALGGVKELMRKFTEKQIETLQIPFIIKEATLSSEIEGTRSTITDVYKGEKVRESDPDIRDDNEEIANYRKALSWALEQNPSVLTEQFIMDLHKILMSGVRGYDKSPGAYKIEQNAIGRRGDNLDSAKFVPASPETTPRLMSNLLDFINDSTVDSFSKIAITHYQFESIHPFMDGNGRIGRLLISIQLCREGILPKPFIYLSDYLSRNRDTYIDTLYLSSASGNIEDFIMFISKALASQAKSALVLLEKIEEYRETTYSQLKEASRSPHLSDLVDLLIRTPIFKVSDVVSTLGISQPAARKLALVLKDLGLVREQRFSNRNIVYFADGILRTLEGRS